MTDAAAVCDIFTNFDSNFANLDGHNSFTPDNDWVMRVLVDQWEQYVPAASRLASVAEAISTALAVCNQLSSYQVKGVCLQKVVKGEEVGSYPISKLAWSFGKTCTSKIVASEGTWLIDLVFRPRVSESNLLGVDGNAWSAYLQKALAGSTGTPVVKPVALFPLIEYSVGDYQITYDEARKFWALVQPYWEINKVSSALSPTGYGYDPHFQINASGPAWASFPQIGQGGVGIALGTAMEPQLLTPLPVSGTISVVGPGTPANVNTPDPNDPSLWPSGLATGWQNLSTAQKAVGVAAGLLLSYGVAKYLFRW